MNTKLPGGTPPPPSAQPAKPPEPEVLFQQMTGGANPIGVLTNCVRYFDSLDSRRTAGREYYERLLDLMRDAAPRLAMERAILLDILARICMYQNDYASAVSADEEALSLCHQTGVRILEVECLTKLGLARYKLGLGQHGRAFEMQKGALVLMDELGETQHRPVILANLGQLYHALGQQDQAIRMCLEALEAARQIGNQQMERSLLMRLEILRRGRWRS